MPERGEWFGGPVEGLVFAVIMVVAAFLGRENPRFVYPEVLYCFLGLLGFNFLNFSVLPRLWPESRRTALAVVLNLLLLTSVLAYSGGPESYFWVLYLLPVFNGCLAFSRGGVLATTGASVLALLAFHAGALRHGPWAGVLEVLIKTTIISASALVVMRVSGREREARQRLEEERRRMERERAQAREQLARMDRLATLGTLIAGVAHELNTPLTAILGYTQIALDPTFALDESRKLFARIEASGRRCRQTIQDMLAFSRQKTERRRLCDVNALLKECLDLKEHDWLLDRIHAELELAEGLPGTLLSGPEFQQVIFNLLTNAHQAIRMAGRPEGHIRLRTSREAGSILVRLSDDGPGVPPEIAERIWEPFFTTKPEGEGTGLGLAICRQIVEAQGGSLTLETSSGGGATFLIRLPVIAQASSPPASGTAPRRPVDKILVADDDSAVRDLLDRVLARYGLPVESATGFEQVLASLREAAPRLLICDLHMPGMGAFDFFQCAEAQGLLSGVPIVIVSGSPPGPNVEAYISQQGWPYLTKPFEMDGMHEAVGKLLTKR